MGERLETWRTRLRSDRFENVAGVILLLGLAGVAYVLVRSWIPLLDWSVTWPVLGAYAAGAVVLGAAAAWLFRRWRPRRLRALRDRLRTIHWGVIAFYGTFAGLAIPFGAPPFAETYVCERGDGIIVQTSWTGQDEDRGTKTGTYTYEGRTYDIVVADDEYLVRQVGPPTDPTEDNEYYTRTYRVPWAGSEMVCSTPEASDFNDLVGLGFVGVLGSAVASSAVTELVRRRRRDDEFERRQRSFTA